MSLIARSLSTGLAAAAALVAYPAAAAPGADIPPEPGVTWEQTVKFEAKGMPMQMPPQTHTVCVPKKEWTHPPRAERETERCQTKDFKRSGNKYTWKIVCDDQEMQGGDAEVVRSASGDSYDGKMTMQSRSMGLMTSTFHGKLIGKPCDAAEQKRQVAGIQAQIAEAQARQDEFKAGVCEQAVQSMNPFYFTTVNGCEDPAKKAEFCKKAQTRQGYIDLSHQGSQIVQKTEQVCSIDMAAVRAQACKETGASVIRVKEPAEDDVQFLASQCPAESQQVAKARCAGRSYTGVNRAYGAICAKYAQEEMEAQEQPKPKAQPKQPSTQDAAVEEGKKAMKGLLGW